MEYNNPFPWFSPLFPLRSIKKKKEGKIYARRLKISSSKLCFLALASNIVVAIFHFHFFFFFSFAFSSKSRELNETLDLTNLTKFSPRNVISPILDYQFFFYPGKNKKLSRLRITGRRRDDRTYKQFRDITSERWSCNEHVLLFNPFKLFQIMPSSTRRFESPR